MEASSRNERELHYIPGALKDLSISRSSFTWGIPVPEDVQRDATATQKHVIYVWLDALANYMTALGYGSQRRNPLQKILARQPPPRRQRDHPLPLRLLARLPPGLNPKAPTQERPKKPPDTPSGRAQGMGQRLAPQSHHRPRLAPLRRLEDVEVQRQHRPHRNHPRSLRHPLPTHRLTEISSGLQPAESDLTRKGL